ncbi:hypothetical protein HAX54_002451 [Datura stramonium]|uniref:Uncharacterized protein n=1 Tax=Datura stramonium TaxID=4076 RepID=A0ABS8RT80_DATST|nr:hypothetical protein [Datura stramonium]
MLRRPPLSNCKYFPHSIKNHRNSTLNVLELGFLVHSMIIGISLGTTENPKIIKTLIIALSFHQFFEGIELGGCISQVFSIFAYFPKEIISIYPILLPSYLTPAQFNRVCYALALLQVMHVEF